MVRVVFSYGPSCLNIRADLFAGRVVWYRSGAICTVLPWSIAPPFYRQNSRLSRFPPLKIPCYTAKLSYHHPPQVFRHKSRKTNLNSPVSTAHNYLLTSAVCPQVFSSGGTCTLLPSFLGVHPNFRGCNVPSNSSFGGTKKMNCIFSTQGRAPCCFL